MTIIEYKKGVEKRIMENTVLKEQIQDCEKKIIENTRKLGCVKDALNIIEKLAMEKRNGIKSGLESVVTEALRMLYDDKYSFEMKYGEKNNRSYLEMRVIKKTEAGEIKRQMDGFGGGVSDSISIPLRMMVLKGSNTGDILGLDEAFKHVDGEKVARVGEFLKTICEKLEIQIIMVTHHLPLLKYADAGFRINYIDGESCVS